MKPILPAQRECIIIFTKYPSPGKVKTRLVPPLGKEQACELYKTMVVSTLNKARKSGKDIFICYSPSRSLSAFIKWLGKGERYMPQKGRGLGVKMKNAFKSVFASGYGKALLIGCDIPDISSGLLNGALKELGRSGSIIGPAKDGGYYLIGFKKERFLPGAFTGIKWSTSSVLSKTLEIFKRNGRKVCFSPELSDIDVASDIARRLLTPSS